MHNLLASGYVPATESFLLYLNFYFSFRSKDGVVNLWNLPNPPPNGLESAEAPREPIALENVSRAQQKDLTSLDWNSEGTLLALGSYDSVLRVCTNQGSVYFSHPQHQVGEYLSISDLTAHALY
jgi:WD40 repeat protein